MNEKKFEEEQKKSVERNAIGAMMAWEKALPTMRAHAQELKDWYKGIVERSKNWGPREKDLENQAFADLLNMNPEEIGNLTKRYYEATRPAGRAAGMWNETIEAQMHLIPNILRKINDLS